MQYPKGKSATFHATMQKKDPLSIFKVWSNHLTVTFRRHPLVHKSLSENSTAAALFFRARIGGFPSPRGDRPAL